MKALLTGVPISFVEIGAGIIIGLGVGFMLGFPNGAIPENALFTTMRAASLTISDFIADIYTRTAIYL